MYIYNFFINFIKCLCILRYTIDTIHDTEKLKIDSRCDSRFDNYAIQHQKQANNPSDL